MLTNKIETSEALIFAKKLSDWHDSMDNFNKITTFYKTMFIKAREAKRESTDQIMTRLGRMMGEDAQFVKMARELSTHKIRPDKKLGKYDPAMTYLISQKALMILTEQDILANKLLQEQNPNWGRF
jgi:hypothetical protein